MDLSNEESSDSESEYSVSESDSSISEQEEGKPNRNINLPKELKRKRSHKTDHSNRMYIINSDDYFNNANRKQARMSNNSLDKLDTPKLPRDELHKLLKSASSEKHPANFKNLEGLNKGLFPRWLYLLHEGFNILIYGLGSKIEVLESFQRKYLCNSPVVVINGFFPSLSIEDVLKVILNDLLEVKKIFSNVSEGCDFISKEMSQYVNLHVYLMVHNIEVGMLKSSKTQNVLSRLATIRNVHLIASIDHVSAPLIWDNTRLSKLNFMWYDVTSFKPYTGETSFEGSTVYERFQTHALSSLNSVFSTLTSNSKGVYMLAVNHQLESQNSQNYQGYLFKDFYLACREAFLVSSDLSLRSQLTEFIDHKLLKMRRSADGCEYLVIPVADNILRQFLDDQSNV